MCITGLSESGHGGRFEPCDAYIKLLSEKSRLEGRCAGLEEGNKINLESIKRQDGQLVGLMKENEALREENQLLRAENANLSMAHGPGTDAPICSRCWRHNAPAPAHGWCSNANFTPLLKGPNRCEEFLPGEEDDHAHS